ncbi:MAG: DegV family protein [SAR202 cluster bacterium]|nr:DegV family protein [SAR202 cluster bacterium]
MVVKVVTDSTSDLPADYAKALDVTIVPLNVSFGTETFKDNVTITADDFYQRLTTATVLPTTSQPSPGDFVEVYDRLGEDAEGIVSIHLSSKESGTHNSAVQAQGMTKANCPIDVVDSEQFSMGLGMIVIKSAEAAARGASVEEVAAIARNAIGLSQCVASFDTLEYLERGGRIGKAKALVGSLLKLKPAIIIRDGQVHELGKTRTLVKSIAQLKDAARSFAPVEALCVLHSTTPDVAAKIAADLSDLLPEGTEPFVARFGPVIGTYTGPGALGIGLIRKEGDEV